MYQMKIGVLTYQDEIGSVLRTAQKRNCYSCFGYVLSGKSNEVFAGLFIEKGLPLYVPGNGSRPYLPGLMRFASSDALSPFGAGGINAYTYCTGDPVNRMDTNGHFASLVGRLKSLKKLFGAFKRPSAEVAFIEKSTAFGVTKKGVFFIDAHGQVGGTWLGDRIVDADELIGEIRGTPVVLDLFKRAKKVELISCFGADQISSGTPSVGEQLALKLGKPVKAYQGEVTGWSGFAYHEQAGNAQEAIGRSPRVYTYSKPQVFGTNNKILFYKTYRFDKV
jgi:RHS repeat-associated protein